MIAVFGQRAFAYVALGIHVDIEVDHQAHTRGPPQAQNRIKVTPAWVGDHTIQARD